MQHLQNYIIKIINTEHYIKGYYVANIWTSQHCHRESLVFEVLQWSCWIDLLQPMEGCKSGKSVMIIDIRR